MQRACKYSTAHRGERILYTARGCDGCLTSSLKTSIFRRTLPCAKKIFNYSLRNSFVSAAESRAAPDCMLEVKILTQFLASMMESTGDGETESQEKWIEYVLWML